MRAGLSSWRVFWVGALAISAVNCAALSRVDLSTQRGATAMILLAIRCALPFFLLAFTASSAARLWPGKATGWLLANRRYLGLAFAFGMAWHLTFVGYLTAMFGYPLNRTFTVLDFTGVTFLLALTLTSSGRAVRSLGGANWKRLHRAGVYVIWLLSTYIFFEFAKEHGDLFDFGALAMMLAAWLVRVAAWWRRRLGRSAASTPIVRHRIS